MGVVEHRVNHHRPVVLSDDELVRLSVRLSRFDRNLADKPSAPDRIQRTPLKLAMFPFYKGFQVQRFDLLIAESIKLLKPEERFTNFDLNLGTVLQFDRHYDRDIILTN